MDIVLKRARHQLINATVSVLERDIDLLERHMVVHVLVFLEGQGPKLFDKEFDTFSVLVAGRVDSDRL